MAIYRQLPILLLLSGAIHRFRADYLTETIQSDDTSLLALPSLG